MLDVLKTKVEDKRIAKLDLISEIKRCKADPAYFAKNYIYIKHKDKGAVKFKLWDFQEKTLRDFQNNRMNIILKSRQLGITELMSMYILWFTLFNKDKNVVVVSKNRKAASNIIKRIKYAYKKLPNWLKITKMVSDNVHTVEFDNDSIIFADATTENAGRGEACSLFIVDEGAFIPALEEMWASVFPTIDNGGSCIIASCVTEDTFVLSDKGIKTIKNFINKDKEKTYEIESYNILGRKKLRSGHIFHNDGLRDTKIITSQHSSVEGSFNHMLYAFSDDRFDYHTLSNLKVGDYVAIQYGTNVWGNNDDVSDFAPNINKKSKNIFNPQKITKEIAYFLGLFISEGSSYRCYKNNVLKSGNVTISCGDDCILDELKKLNLHVSRTKGDNIHSTISSKNLIEFLEYLKFDLKLKAKHKIIPERLLEMSRENIIQLLQGIFDGDGTCQENNGLVSIRLSSEKLIQQIRQILLNIGITTTFVKGVSSPTDKVKVFSNYYGLEMNKSQSKKFYDIIGFKIQRKNIKNKFKEKQVRDNDVLPNSEFLFSYLLSFSNFNHSQLRRLFKVRSDGKKGKTKHQISKLYSVVREFLSDRDCEFYDFILNDNIKWSKITSIQDSKNYVYDFSLPCIQEDDWDHSVIYNGFLGHQTPNGASGQFYELYTQAPGNGFNPIWLDWNCHPDRDAQWFEKTKKSMSPKKFAQEFLGSFLLSGDTVIDGEDIARHSERTIEPFLRNGPEKDVWYWKEYDFSHRYVIGADTARGDGEDYSAFNVIDAEQRDIACEYKGKIKVDKFAELLASVGYQYGTAVIVVENNGYGLAVLMKLIDLKYPAIYCEDKSTREYVEGYIDYENDNIVLGFTTRLETRILAIDKLEESIRLDQIVVYSPRIILEFRNFIFENGKPKARKNSNDDLVMSLAIGLYVCSKIYANQDSDSMFKKKLLENITFLSSKISYKVPGEIGFDSKNNAFNMESVDPYKVKFKDQSIDFRFLIDSNSRNKNEKVENKGIHFLGVLR